VARYSWRCLVYSSLRACCNTRCHLESCQIFTPLKSPVPLWFGCAAPLDGNFYACKSSDQLKKDIPVDAAPPEPSLGDPCLVEFFILWRPSPGIFGLSHQSSPLVSGCIILARLCKLRFSSRIRSLMAFPVTCTTWSVLECPPVILNTTASPRKVGSKILESAERPLIF